MQRPRISRLMDGAGFLFVTLGLILFASGDKLGPPASSGWLGGTSAAAADIVIFMTQWLFLMLGTLLFLGRPFLRLRWWRVWIAFLGVGVLLVTAFFYFANTDSSFWGVDLGGDVITIIEVAGFASILMGLIFLLAQRLVRQAEPKSSTGL